MSPKAVYLLTEISYLGIWALPLEQTMWLFMLLLCFGFFGQFLHLPQESTELSPSWGSTRWHESTHIKHPAQPLAHHKHGMLLCLFTKGKLRPKGFKHHCWSQWFINHMQERHSSKPIRMTRQPLLNYHNISSFTSRKKGTEDSSQHSLGRFSF